MGALREHFETMARYGEWATRRLLASVDALTDDAYRRPAGLFFGSVHATLNHLLVAEHGLWFRRFADGVSPALKLNDEIETDRAALHTRLLVGSRHWAPWVATLTEERLAGMLRYTGTDGTTRTLPFGATLAHVFNHGTHHRGQITAALTAMGHRCPELDLVWMLQTESAR